MSLEADILSRILIALGLSAVVGWEREAAGKSAGVRTHMLVGVGACLFVVLGELFLQRPAFQVEQMRYETAVLLHDV